MGKSKYELSRLVDECREKNSCDIFHLCRDCMEKLEHTGRYNISKMDPRESLPLTECDLCDSAGHPGFEYIITSRPATTAYTISRR